MAMQCLFDVAETRVALGGDRLALSVDGRTWDRKLGSNTWIDPVTRSLMLRPYQLTSAWQTTFTGNYARLPLSSLSSPDGAGGVEAAHSTLWQQISAGDTGNYYITDISEGGAGEPIYTTATNPANTAFCVSFWVAGGGRGNDAAIECGWGVPDAEGTVSLRVFSGGEVEVWKGDARVGRGSIVSQWQEVVETKRGQDGAEAETTTRSIEDSLVTLLLIPCRQRELLVISNMGGGFSHVFADLPIGTNNEITTNDARFWVAPPTGKKVTFQLSPLRYPTTGTAYSIAQQMPFAPAAGADGDHYQHTGIAGFGTASVAFGVYDALLAPVLLGDGATDILRLGVTLTGDGTNSPQIYCDTFAYDVTPASTSAAEQVDLSGILDGTSSVLKSLDLSVGDSPDGVTLTVTAANLTAIAAGGLAQPYQGKNRPVAVVYDGVEIFRGATGEIRHGLRPNESAESVVWECQDRWKRYNRYRWTDANITPFDGMLATDAIKILAKLPGYTDADLDIEESTLRLPFSFASSRGEFLYCPEVGDSLADTILRIHKDFFGSWFVGWVPTSSGWRFRFRSESTLGTAPALITSVSLDETRLRLIAGGMTTAQADATKYYATFREFKETTSEPVANEVYATGYDRYSRTVFQARQSDTANQDPTTLPSLHSEDWQGERILAGMADPRLTSQAATDAAAQNLADVLFPTEIIAEGRAAFLRKSDGVPVWRGDVLRVTGWGDYRVLSLSGGLRREGATIRWQDFTYTMKWIGPEPEPEA